MKILVTGSEGFVGRNLVWNLKEIRDGKNRTRPSLKIEEIYGYDMENTKEDLEEACENCDFVFHLAGKNRPKEQSEYMEGNFGFSSELLDMLKKHRNTCPVMLASSIQASLAGRFADSEYGKSKLAGENLFFRYGAETGARVLVYRFPNLFGKWCRPGYNSAVATFCHAVANDLEYTVNDRNTKLELLYIDDLICEMLDALEGKEHRCEYTEDGVHDGPAAVNRQDGTPEPAETRKDRDPKTVKSRQDEGPETEKARQDGTPETVKTQNGQYCYVPTTHQASLGEVVDLLNTFKQMPATLTLPEIPEDSFAKKLYSTYLSYLPPSQIAYGFRSNVDSRGNFTELLRTRACGQVSINVAGPGVTRGEHWHNSKWEIFIVVSGHGLIRQRRIGTDPETRREYPVIEFEVTGRQMRAVQILPGYTHGITNLSDIQDLVTVMWANEAFDENHPDTFREPVSPEE